MSRNRTKTFQMSRGWASWLYFNKTSSQFIEYYWLCVLWGPAHFPPKIVAIFSTKTSILQNFHLNGQQNLSFKPNVKCHCLKIYLLQFQDIFEEPIWRLRVWHTLRVSSGPELLEAFFHPYVKLSGTDQRWLLFI